MLIVGFSILKTRRRCNRLYNYKYVQKLTRKRPKIQLIRGTIIHAMLDADAKKLPVAPVLAKFQKEYGKLFLEEREEYGDLIGDCQRIYDNYHRTYHSDRYKVLGSEVELKVPLIRDKSGVLVQFQGHIDKVWQDAHKRRWVVDHKTHKNIPGEEQRFSDLQTVFYTWAYNQLNPKKPVEGVIWDYLRTKTPSTPEVLKNGTLSRRANIDTDYGTALHAVQEYLKNPVDGDSLHNYEEWLAEIKAKENKFFKRVYLPSPPAAMVDQVVREMVNTSRQILAFPDADDRNMTRDCSWCEFYVLCHAELRGQDANYIRKSEYKVKEIEDEEDKEDDE